MSRTGASTMVLGSLAAVLLWGAPAPLRAAPAIPLNVDQFAANLEKEAKNRCVGFGYAIYQNGNLVRQGAGGWARVASDAPSRKFDPETRIDIGSCTKFITALAVLEELERQPQVSLDSPIHPYLPSGWPIHASVKGISFRQILSHKSGLRQVGTPSRDAGKINDTIKATLKQGVVDPAKGYSYQNVNFAMCRVLLPYLHDGAAMRALESDVVAHERGTAECMIRLCQQYVLNPAGLNYNINATTWDKSPTRPETLSYDFANPVAGEPNKDSTLVIGAGGWWMNARELGKVCSALARGKLLGSKTRGFMEDGNLGFYRITGKHGDYFWHNGQGGSAKTSHADFMLFPNDVQVAWVLNSAGNTINNYGDGGAYRGTLKKAFDDACEQADLRVKSMQLTGDAVYQGEFLNVPFRLTVENAGAAATPAQFLNAVYRGDRVEWTGFMSPLKAGESRAVDGTVKLRDPGRTLSGRILVLRGRADARIQAGDTSVPDWAFIQESDEGNNLSGGIQVKVPVVGGTFQPGLQGGPRPGARP